MKSHIERLTQENANLQAKRTSEEKARIASMTSEALEQLESVRQELGEDYDKSHAAIQNIITTHDTPSFNTQQLPLLRTVAAFSQKMKRERTLLEQFSEQAEQNRLLNRKQDELLEENAKNKQRISELSELVNEKQESNEKLSKNYYGVLQNMSKYDFNQKSSREVGKEKMAIHSKKEDVPVKSQDMVETATANAGMLHSTIDNKSGRVGSAQSPPVGSVEWLSMQALRSGSGSNRIFGSSTSQSYAGGPSEGASSSFGDSDLTPELLAAISAARAFG
jgi:hypothetical protein